MKYLKIFEDFDPQRVTTIDKLTPGSYIFCPGEASSGEKPCNHMFKKLPKEGDSCPNCGMKIGKKIDIVQGKNNKIFYCVNPPKWDYKVLSATSGGGTPPTPPLTPPPTPPKPGKVAYASSTLPPPKPPTPRQNTSNSDFRTLCLILNQNINDLIPFLSESLSIEVDMMTEYLVDLRDEVCSSKSDNYKSLALDSFKTKVLKNNPKPVFSFKYKGYSEKILEAIQQFLDILDIELGSTIRITGRRT
jgi:hypothetical protein